MSKKKQKLELTWIGKDDRPNLEPRILIEDPDLSYHAHEKREGDIFDNLLIQGDNLLALKAMEANYSGRVDCVCIDPPYNTGSAILDYEDGLEHSIWLSLIRERLAILSRLLSDDGSIWIFVDDNEGHYLKVLCDEVFGRKNFVSTVIWQKKYGPKADSKYLSSSHDFILCYAKDISHFQLAQLPKTEKQNARYTNRDNDPRGPWKAGDVLRNEVRDYAIFPVELPSGEKVLPPSGTSWRYGKEKFAELIADNRIWFGVEGTARPAIKRFLSEVRSTIPAESIWFHTDVGHNDLAKKESRNLFGEQLFSTPKPEKLIERIFTLATKPGDLVIDSFAGSGTTGAVAHKMGRRWIMIELEDHCKTHCLSRLRKVIDAEDNGGITEPTNWKGGGGFRYYHLAPSLLEKDKYGNWVISKEYNASMLAEAMCKNLGFTYSPSQDEQEYWRHGHSTETDFIFVTTTSMTHAALKKLSEDVGPDRTLLVCCKAFNADADAFDNLTIKKIPHAVLSKCEWGKDDYSLNVANLPMAKTDEEIEEERMRDELPLFGQGEEE